SRGEMSIRDEPEHGEVGVPVIELPEAPAWNDVGLRYVKERRIGRWHHRLPCQERPEPCDVSLQALVPLRGRRVHHSRQGEGAIHELEERSAGPWPGGAISPQNGKRRALR